MNINKIIADNILSLMEKKGKKKEDFAAAMRMSKSEVTWMLNGRRALNAIELKQIAKFLRVEVMELTKIPSSSPSPLSPSSSTSSPSSFQKEKESEGVKEAVEIAEELADMVVFHGKVKENGEKMRKSWKLE